MLISKNILRQGHKLVSQEEASIVVEKLLAREILFILILTQVLHQWIHWDRSSPETSNLLKISLNL
jgi:hypothetical protein